MANVTFSSEKIGVQIYSVRHLCKTIDDLDRVVDELTQIGYRRTQVSGIEHLDPEDIRRVLDRYDMACCGTHDTIDRFLNDTESVIRNNTILGSPYCAVAYPGVEYWVQGSGPKLVKELNQAAKHMNDAGIRFGYHNHHHEFSTYGTDRTLMDYIVEETDPDLVHLELDVHWIMRGGADPVEWINRLAPRLFMIHLKDFAIDNGEPAYAAIGQGNMNWRSIIAACSKAGIQEYVVEQDSPREGRPMMQSLRMSYDFLSAMGSDEARL